MGIPQSFALSANKLPIRAHLIGFLLTIFRPDVPSIFTDFMPIFVHRTFSQICIRCPDAKLLSEGVELSAL